MIYSLCKFTFINGFWSGKHWFLYSYWWKEVTDIQTVKEAIKVTDEFSLHLNSMKVKGSWSNNIENVSRFVLCLETDHTAVSEYKSHTRHFGQVEAQLIFTEKETLSVGHNGLLMRTQKNLQWKAAWSQYQHFIQYELYSFLNISLVQTSSGLQQKSQAFKFHSKWCFHPTADTEQRVI